MLNRIAGKLIFATLRDGSGDLQVMIAADAVGEESIELWKENVDLGDCKKFSLSPKLEPRATIAFT